MRFDCERASTLLVQTLCFYGTLRSYDRSSITVTVLRCRRGMGSDSKQQTLDDIALDGRWVYWNRRGFMVGELAASLWIGRSWSHCCCTQLLHFRDDRNRPHERKSQAGTANSELTRIWVGEAWK